MEALRFYNINTELPTYNAKYEGLYVLDKNNNLYLGTPDGWKELTNSEIGDLTSLTTAEKDTLVGAINELKTQLDTSINTYSLEMTDDGSVRCVKNGNEDGFEFGSDGSVSIA